MCLTLKVTNQTCWTIMCPLLLKALYLHDLILLRWDYLRRFFSIFVSFRLDHSFLSLSAAVRILRWTVREQTWHCWTSSGSTWFLSLPMQISGLHSTCLYKELQPGCKALLTDKLKWFLYWKFLRSILCLVFINLTWGLCLLTNCSMKVVALI